MKPLFVLLAIALAAVADTLPVPAPLPESDLASSNCEDELNRAKRFDCYRAKRKGPDYRPTMVEESAQAQWDTVTTISINGQDTTLTVTIKRAENWEGTKKDFNRFVDMFVLLGVLNILGTALLMVATFAN